MKIEANSIEELIEASGKNKDHIILIDKFISECLPNLVRYFFVSDSFSMIGYGEVKHFTKKGEVLWPLIAIAPQKHMISMYFSVYNDSNIVDKYRNKLGKVSYGKQCVRVKKFDDLNLDIFKEMLLTINLELIK